MPIYEYSCENCGKTLEAFQSLSDPALKDCHDCQKPTLKRLVSAAGFRLKGQGWYETDFKNNDKKKNVIRAEDSHQEASPVQTPSETKQPETS